MKCRKNLSCRKKALVYGLLGTIHLVNRDLFQTKEDAEKVIQHGIVQFSWDCRSICGQPEDIGQSQRCKNGLKTNTKKLFLNKPYGITSKSSDFRTNRLDHIHTREIENGKRPLKGGPCSGGGHNKRFSTLLL